jgi:hypothetical protein
MHVNVCENTTPTITCLVVLDEWGRLCVDVVFWKHMVTSYVKMINTYGMRKNKICRCELK